MRKLYVRNVQSQTLHFWYELPQHKCLHMAFPDPISLPPGLSAELDIIFRPTAYEEIDDCLTIHVANKGSFTLPVQACLAKVSVRVTEEANFDIVPVNEPTQVIVEIENNGDTDAHFSWDVPTPFLFDPKVGVVHPGDICNVTVTVVPEDASVLRSMAVCSIQGGEQEHTLRLHAQGKYQHIMVVSNEASVQSSRNAGIIPSGSFFSSCSQDVEGTVHVDFGEVYTSSALSEIEKKITIRNSQYVRATINVENLPMVEEEICPPLFSISPSTVTLAPGEEIDFTVRISRATAGIYKCEQFRLHTLGGNSIPIAVTARFVGPSVSIAQRRGSGDINQKVVERGPVVLTDSATFYVSDKDDILIPHVSDAVSSLVSKSRIPLVFQFGSVKIGQKHTIVFTLTNHSPVPASFHFAIDSDAVFRFSQLKGSIPPRLAHTLSISFAPQAAGNFYRRVACLILEGAPLYVDLIGTAYDDKSRPAPLKYKHVLTHRLLPPSLRLATSEEIITAAETASSVCPQRLAEECEFSLSFIPSRSGDATRASNAVFREFCAFGRDPTSPVVLLDPLLDFAAASRFDAPKTLVTAVQNRSHVRQILRWCVPVSKSTLGSQGRKDFAITPEYVELDPGATVQFEVSFTPTVDSFSYFQVRSTHRFVYPHSFPRALRSSSLFHHFHSPSSFFSCRKSKRTWPRR